MAKNNLNNESSSVARFGYVSAYDEKKHMAKILFPDKDNLISGWIPVAVRNSLKNHDEHHFDIGEHVFCVMQGNGIESGCVLCAVYDDTNKPPVSDQNKRAVTFDDGTSIIYDRSSKKLSINCVGDIEIHSAGNITITGQAVNVSKLYPDCVNCG